MSLNETIQQAMLEFANLGDEAYLVLTDSATGLYLNFIGGTPIIMDVRTDEMEDSIAQRLKDYFSSQGIVGEESTVGGLFKKNKRTVAMYQVECPVVENAISMAQDIFSNVYDVSDVASLEVSMY